MKKTVVILLTFAMIMVAVSCGAQTYGAQNAPQGVWTGQIPDGDAFSVIFIDNKVFLPERDSFDNSIASHIGTFAFEKNAGTCSFAYWGGETLTIPFAIKGTSMNFGPPDSETGDSIPLSKDTSPFSIPPGIGGFWTARDYDDIGLVFINNIVYLYETGHAMKAEYTYSNGSGSVNVKDPYNGSLRILDFTVSGNTLTSTWRGSVDPFVYTR
ncbi:MAG: hypothetical protein LBL45_00265 [Treponema sp.]|nr:hypothetical protein [Treponema sp.]